MAAGDRTTYHLQHGRLDLNGLAEVCIVLTRPILANSVTPSLEAASSASLADRSYYDKRKRNRTLNR